MEEREEIIKDIDENIKLVPTDLLDVVEYITKEMTKPGRSIFYSNLRIFLEREGLKSRTVGDQD